MKSESKTSGHIPVMLNEILEAFLPQLQKEEPIRYFDGTFGRGGHCRALLQRAPQISAVAFDQDLAALDYARENFSDEIGRGQLQILHRNFGQFAVEEQGLFDIMLLDLGVSSPQLDQAERGFSFYHDGPLDMRMNTQDPETAADIINDWDEEDLVTLFQKYGEIFKPYRVVRAIVHDRKTTQFETTRQLAGLIERVEGWRKKGFHPATQFFMALRLKVNNELGVVEEGLPKLMAGLKSKGRLAVLTFHSLEDRIVKNIFKSAEELGHPVNKKVIAPTRDEQELNSRARSAKLRIFERD